MRVNGRVSRSTVRERERERENGELKGPIEGLKEMRGKLEVHFVVFFDE